MLKESPIQADDNIRKIFPPALFLPFDNNQSDWERWSYGRATWNVKHRISRFLIDHAEELKLQSPGSLERFIRILTDTYSVGENGLKGTIDAQLRLLYNIPGNPFCVTGELFFYRQELDGICEYDSEEKQLVDMMFKICKHLLGDKTSCDLGREIDKI